jgi:hypothetical protein
MPEAKQIPWNEVTPGQRIGLSRTPDVFNPAAIIATGVLAEISREDLDEAPLRSGPLGLQCATNCFRMQGEGEVVRQFANWIACELPKARPKKKSEKNA